MTQPDEAADKLRKQVIDTLETEIPELNFGVEGRVGPAADAILAIVTAEIGAAEIAALKAARDDMRGISFEHGDKVNGNHDFMRGISAARELLADRIRNHFGIGEKS